MANPTVPSDSVKMMRMGVTADTTLAFGMAADASQKNWAANAQVDLGSERFYVEHFVFALHLHAFMFLLFTRMLLLRSVDLLPGLLFLWMCVYSWIAMKRVCEQGFFKTTAKWLVVGWAYLVVL